MRGWVASPFTTLARVHAMSVATDAIIATSLAGSLFFSIPTGAARGRVALYLVLTMAPFAVVAPLIGPAIDRVAGGRRLMIIGSCALRGVVCFFMAPHTDDLLLFPLAFAALVLGKAYGIAKSALVPTVVDSEAGLVRANSRLAVLSGVMGFLAAAPAALLVKLFGGSSALLLGALTSIVAVVLALRLKTTAVAPEPAGELETAELRGEGIHQASEAMGLLRGIVGFTTFLLAFDLRGGGADGPVPVGLALGRAVRQATGLPVAQAPGAEGAPTWHFGLVIGCSVAAGLVGSVLAPRVRRILPEERILLGTLACLMVLAALAAVSGGLLGACLLAASVGMGANAAKLAFDSLVQRDAPDANFGRSFAGFETRFQIVWVLGGFLPVIVPIPAQLGYAMVAIAAGFAAFAYATGVRHTKLAARLGGGWGESAPIGLPGQG